MFSKILSGNELHNFSLNTAYRSIKDAMGLVFKEKEHNYASSVASRKFLHGLFWAFKVGAYEAFLEKLSVADEEVWMHRYDDLVFHGEALLGVTRTGWEKRKIDPCENVAEHTYGAFRLFDACYRLLPLNISNPVKVAKMLFVHDFAEYITGDLVDTEGSSVKNITTAEKKELESAAIVRIFKDHPEPLALWLEFEQQSSPEAILAKQIDKLEAVFQAAWYVENGRAPVSVLHEFIDTTRKHVVSEPVLRGMLDFVVNG